MKNNPYRLDRTKLKIQSFEEVDNQLYITMKRTIYFALLWMFAMNISCTKNVDLENARLSDTLPILRIRVDLPTKEISVFEIRRTIKLYKTYEDFEANTNVFLEIPVKFRDDILIHEEDCNRVWIISTHEVVFPAYEEKEYWMKCVREHNYYSGDLLEYPIELKYKFSIFSSIPKGGTLDVITKPEDWTCESTPNYCCD